MRDVLTDLYYGRVSPWERRSVHGAERREIDRNIEEEKRYFLQKMSSDDCQRFEELEDLYIQSYEPEQVDAFSFGSKLGVKMMNAVFTDIQSL